jgi:hypothetical protein
MILISGIAEASEAPQHQHQSDKNFTEVHFVNFLHYEMKMFLRKTIKDLSSFYGSALKVIGILVFQFIIRTP